MNTATATVSAAALPAIRELAPSAVETAYPSTVEGRAVPGLEDLARPVSAIAERLAAAASRAEKQGFIDSKMAADGRSKRKGGLADFSERRSDVFFVNPFLVHIKPDFNSRNFEGPGDPQDIIPLAHDIAAQGVRRAFDVHYTEGKIWVIDGERRWRAVMYAINVLGVAVEAIPVQTGGRSQNQEDRDFAPLECNTAKPFTIYETGEHYRKLLKRGISLKRIAERQRISEVRVGQIIDLCSQSTPVIRQLVESNQLAASTALKILKSEASPERAEALLTQASATATEQGKRKVTPKLVAATAASRAGQADVGVVRATAQAFRTVFSAAESAPRADGGLTLTLTAAQHAAYRRLMTVG